MAVLERAVVEAAQDAGLAFAGEQQRDDLVEARQRGGRQGIEERLEFRVALGEAQRLGVGAAEVAPDLDDAVGGRGADLLDVAGDLLGEGLGQLLLHLVLVLFRLHLGGDDRQHAVAQVPDVLGDEHEADAAGDHRDEARQHAADEALADARRHVGELAAHQQHGGAGDAAARLTQHGARRHLGGALAGIERDVLAGVADDGARGGLAVARADKGLEAGERRLGRVLAGELHLLADLVADARRRAARARP